MESFFTCDGEKGRPLIGESLGVLGSSFLLLGDGVNIGEATRPCSTSGGVFGAAVLGGASSGSVLILGSVFTFILLVFCTLPLLVDDTDTDES